MNVMFQDFFLKIHLYPYSTFKIICYETVEFPMVYMIKFFMEGHLVFKASTASYQYGNTCITLQCLHCIKLIASLY